MFKVILGYMAVLGESLWSQRLHYTGSEDSGRDEKLRQFSRGKTVFPPIPIRASSQVSDFGLSKWMEQSSRMQYVKRSALQGTLSYIPPEMFLESNKGPGPKYDVYR